MNKKNITFGLYTNVYEKTMGATIPYIEYLSKWGFVRLVGVTDNIEDVMNQIDVLVVPGGPDVDSKRYNETPHVKNSNPSPYYEWLDLNLLTPWIQQGRPTIGICRGAQTINVVMGGTLAQHIVGHSLFQNENRSSRKDEMFTDIEGYNIYKINSIHHQCIKDIAEGLEVIGWGQLYKNDPNTNKNWKFFKHDYTKKDKNSEPIKSTNLYYSVPELIVGKEKPIVLAQFHPKLFGAL